MGDGQLKSSVQAGAATSTVREKPATYGWPQSLIEIAEIIGPEATLKLVEAYRGQDFCYVPKRITEKSALVQIIGIEAATKLSQAAAGDKIFMPELAVAKSRKQLIAEAEGTTAEIARRYNVSARWVREVRQPLKARNDNMKRNRHD